MEKDETMQILHLLRERLVGEEGAERVLNVARELYPGARRAAVLLSLFEQEGELYIVFIKRATTLRSHGGEIALPGGGMDPDDGTVIMTALREAQEEIALDPARVEVLGILPPVFTVVSNYIIIPVVGYLPSGPGQLQLQLSEVTELIQASLKDLMNPSIAHTELWTRNGQVRTVYFYDYGPYRIWGATGHILHLFLQKLEEEARESE